MTKKEEKHIGGSGLVNPDGVPFRLAKLLTVAVCQQLHCETVNRLVRHTLHEVDSRGDVAPLVASANLTDTPIVAVQVEIIICLHALIRELGKTRTIL